MADRDTIQAMIRYGGGFVSQLGRAALNHDNAGYFVQELAKAGHVADTSNLELLYGIMPDLKRFVEMPEADRLQHIKDAWPELWAQYADMGERDIASRNVLEGESAADLGTLPL